MTSTLILEPEALEVVTATRTCDTRTALAQGLAEYLRQLSFTAPGGRESRFRKVVEAYGEPEIEAVYPSAAVYADAKLTYGGEGDNGDPLTPGLRSRNKLRDGRYFIEPDECVLQLSVETWSTDPKERVAVAAMMEDAASPVEWMSGFRLVLPHYYGRHASYLLTGSSFADDDGDASRRYRRAVFDFTARLARVRVLGKLPAARLHARLEVDGVEVGPT